MESNSLLPNSQFLYIRGLGTYDTLVTVSHHLQVALNRGMERRLVQLNFSAAFDRISHHGLLYKLRCLGVEDSSRPYYRNFVAIEGSTCVWIVRAVPQLM